MGTPVLLENTLTGRNVSVSLPLTLACASKCETCSGPDPSDCSLCSSSFLKLPTSSECIESCPSGFFTNNASRECEPCSDAHCLDCSSGTAICNSCSTISFYYLDGVSCSLCPSPDFTGHDFCRSCTLEGYAISDTGECEELCGDGLLLSLVHECDDGNTSNGDGCSSECLVESGYLCERVSTSSSDECNQIINLGISSF